MLRILLGAVGMLALGCAMHGGPAEVKTPTDAADGRHVRITGTAENDKLGAAVSGPIHVVLLDVQAWPQGRVGETVVVEGVLEYSRDLEARVDDAGAISQGTGGPIWVIRHSTLK